jgi:hypothetical protein
MAYALGAVRALMVRTAHSVNGSHGTRKGALMRYYVEYTAETNGTRVISARWVDLIEGYTTFSDIPSIIEASTGHKAIVVLTATLKD